MRVRVRISVEVRISVGTCKVRALLLAPAVPNPSCSTCQACMHGLRPFMQLILSPEVSNTQHGLLGTRGHTSA